MDISNNPYDEVTLRLYQNSSAYKGRDLVRKAILSCGLLSPNDTRDVIVDVFWVIVKASKEEIWLTSKDVEDKVRESRGFESLSFDGCAGSNIRRILKQLIDFGIVERQSAKYRIVDFRAVSDVFLEVFDKKIEKIKKRVKNLFDEI